MRGSLPLPCRRVASFSPLRLTGEPNVVVLGLGRGEAEQPGPFVVYRCTVLFLQWLERFDEEGRPVALALDLPEPSHEAIDEHGRPPQVVHDPFAMIVADDAAAVGVTDQHVVELRQEPSRCGCVRVGSCRSSTTCWSVTPTAAA